MVSYSQTTGSDSTEQFDPQIHVADFLLREFSFATMLIRIILSCLMMCCIKSSQSHFIVIASGHGIFLGAL